MNKKCFCLFLCLVMVFSLGVTAFAAQPKYEAITGEYNYCPSLGFLDSVNNQTYSFTYSDEYFTHSGYDYNHALAIMSMVLTQTSFASATSSTKGWETANENFNDLVTKCGFTKLAANKDATSHPEGETIGVCAASKQIVDDKKEYTLIAIGIRGHNYGGEWYSNFDTGIEGEHKGFADARDKVLSFLKSYIADNNITGNVKIWVTGYSRAAITANMVGGALDQGYALGNAKLAPKDLYCYTFETPQGVYDSKAHTELYNNIHNILNHNDLLPLVSFSEWGQTRYGVDYYLPCRQHDTEYDNLKPAVNSILDNLGWMNAFGVTLNTIDDFHYMSLDPDTAASKKNVTQIEFYPELIEALFDSIAPSREYYVNNVKNDIQAISNALFGVDTNQISNAMLLFAQKLSSDDCFTALVDSINNESNPSEGKSADLIVDLFMEAMQEANCANYNNEQVRAALKNLVPKVIALVKDHPDTALTLSGNIFQIVNAHFPEIGLAWMIATPEMFFEEQNQNSSNKIGFFTDVTEDRFCYDAVKWAYENDIAGGYDTSTFAPDNPCTRGQVVTFLWRAAGCPEPTSNTCKFIDVFPSSPYYKAIIWATEQNIALGYDGTHFIPSGGVSRGQFVTFLWRYEGQPKSSEKCPFVDVSSSSPYYQAIVWASDNKITLGYDKIHFGPNDLCTRGQVVTFIYRDMV